MTRKSKPAPAGYYRVLIRDLVLAARIGVWKREKLADQRVRVNIELHAARADFLLAPDGRSGRQIGRAHV